MKPNCQEYACAGRHLNGSKFCRFHSVVNDSNSCPVFSCSATSDSQISIGFCLRHLKMTQIFSPIYNVRQCIILMQLYHNIAHRNISSET